MEIIDTELYLYSESNGGRHSPILGRTDRSFYRPHIVIGDPAQKVAIYKTNEEEKKVSDELYLGVQFRSTPDHEYLPTEEKIRVTMELSYLGRVDYTKAIEGATFTLREGGRVIGYGTILNRMKEKTREPVSEGNER